MIDLDWYRLILILLDVGTGFNFILVLILMLLLIGADHDWRWLKLIWLVLIWVDFDWCWFILIEIYWCWLNVSILQLAVLNPIFNIHFHIEMNIDSAGDFIISMLIFVIFGWYWSTLMIVLSWHWLTLIDWYGLYVKCKRYFCFASHRILVEMFCVGRGKRSFRHATC